MLFWILFPALTTIAGGLLVYVWRKPSDTSMDVMLAFAGGVMLAATSFSLLVPATQSGSLLQVLGGFAVGAALIAILDHNAPHIHKRFASDDPSIDEEQLSKQRRGWLIFSALFIHNIPEGMAVGVAFAAGGMELGVPIALAIGIQNFPEGLAAATPLVAAGHSRAVATAAAAASGIIEPIAALAAYLAISALGGMLAPALALAAAAMLYVVIDEIVPEVQQRGKQLVTTLALISGFALMMSLDVGLS